MKRKQNYQPVDTPDQYEEQPSGCLQMFIFAVIIALLFLWIVSCNNAQHMQKVYPKGYYMHGKYLSNHSKPRDINHSKPKEKPNHDSTTAKR